MENKTNIQIFDGDYEILYSESFNVYENKLIIKNFLDKEFVYIFETEDRIEDHQDINVKWEDKIAIITLSKKFRNALGSGTLSKLKILKNQENQKDIYMSVYGSSFSDKNLNVVINFYTK